MAYSPLLGGAYVNDDRSVPLQYQSVVNDFRLKNLEQVASEQEASPNAVVLAWMMQSSSSVIPMVTGSSVKQLEENMQALSIRLTESQLALLNQDIVQPQKYS